MRIEIIRTNCGQAIEIARDDGSRGRFSIPAKGPLPHDAVHYCVESTLGMRNAFWGSIAAGADPSEIEQRAKQGGHASSKRAEPPDAALIELLQAERLVECFEAESWSGGEDDEGISTMAEAGWRASHVPPLALSAAQIAEIRRRLAAIAAEWRTTGQGEAMVLDWHQEA